MVGPSQLFCVGLITFMSDSHKNRLSLIAYYGKVYVIVVCTLSPSMQQRTVSSNAVAALSTHSTGSHVSQETRTMTNLKIKFCLGACSGVRAEVKIHDEHSTHNKYAQLLFIFPKRETWHIAQGSPLVLVTQIILESIPRIAYHKTYCGRHNTVYIPCA